jgi:hypothetical protein
MKKNFRIGTLNGERVRSSGFSGLPEALRSAVAVFVWLLVLLVSFPLGKHMWMRSALKLAYSSGCILAYCGLSLLRYRD